MSKKIVFSILTSMLFISMIFSMIYWNNISIKEFKETKNSINILLDKISFRNTFQGEVITSEKYNLLTLGSKIDIQVGFPSNFHALLNYNLISNIPQIIESYNHKYILKSTDWISMDSIKIQVPEDTSLIGQRFILNLEVEKMRIEQEGFFENASPNKITFYTTNDITRDSYIYETIILDKSTINSLRTENSAYNRFLFGNIIIIQLFLILLFALMYHSNIKDDNFLQNITVVYFSCAVTIIIFLLIIAEDFIKRPIGTFIGYALLSGVVYFINLVYIIIYDSLIRLFDYIFKTHNVRNLYN